MKHTDNNATFNQNFKMDKGRNRKELKKFILADREWVQAFLQAQNDMREIRMEKHNSKFAY
ncbi:MAG: hypothetical protein H8E60_10065 [Candidatus Marinimicrobia bacterium]|nr:hypothetical protein [Candidatus Neomarinimicrobiota bacterium]